MEIESVDQSQDTSIKLNHLPGLPDREWADLVAQNFPDVVTPDVLTQDFKGLDKLGDAIIRDRRNNRVGIAVVAGMIAVMAAGVVLVNTEIVEPSITSKMISVSLPIVLIGAIAYTVYGALSSQTLRIHYMVQNWNARGQTWVQQQRERLSINL